MTCRFPVAIPSPLPLCQQAIMVLIGAEAGAPTVGSFLRTMRPAGTDLTVHGGGVFDLESFWVRGWPSYTSDVTAHGYLNGAETFVQTFTISDTYIQVPTNFSHIDRFALTMQSPRNLLIDDIHLTITPASTPAPGALLTGLLGAVPGVCLLRLRRRRRAPQSD